YEALRDLPTKASRVQTPIDFCDATELAAPVTIVPILRAGLGMTDGMLRLVPEARVGHIGVQRNEETHQPVEYYEKLPTDIAE
ncbi:MAG: uracil phosphoribosyltransferase, partial [Phycisphaerales bacterium]